MVHKLSYRPAASPERLLVAAVRDRVSISLSDWIATQIIHGGTVEEIRQKLMSALGQINRVEGYVADRDRPSPIAYDHARGA
jgi:hypothetical protein